MEYNLKCQLCGKQLQVSSKCTCPLGEHLLQKHPNVDLTFFSSYEDLTIEQSCTCNLADKKNVKTPIWLCRNYSYKKLRNKNIIYKTAKYRSSKRSKINNKTIISTTVEIWKESNLKVTCPKCKIVDRPELRKRTQRTANTPLSIFCMLSCWPLCFFPFLKPKNSLLDLFCRNCGYFLGDYNLQLIKEGPRKIKHLSNF